MLENNFLFLLPDIIKISEKIKDESESVYLKEAYNFQDDEENEVERMKQL